MSTAEKDIVALETRFWQSMQDKDAKAAKAMIAEKAIVVGPMGTMLMDPDKYESMTEQGDWTLKSFTLGDADVIFPTTDIAVIAYTVHQIGEMRGEPMDIRCADSTVWTKAGSDWKVVLHTETILMDARQSQPA